MRLPLAILFYVYFLVPLMILLVGVVLFLLLVGLQCLCLIIQLNSGKVVAVGPGAHSRDGKLIPVSVKEGETVLLPEYGGTEVKLGDKE